MCVLCLQCKVVPRARLTACVICVTASTARWQRRTCSVGAVRRGQGYFERCSDSLTSTMPSSTCTLPSCALLWVICEFARLSAGVCACQHVSSSVTKHPHYFIQKIMWILLYFSPQLCVSGNNLLNICKLIFQISRTESNDILFQNNSVIGQDGTVDNIVVIYSVTLVWNFVNKYDCMSYTVDAWISIGMITSNVFCV